MYIKIKIDSLNSEEIKKRYKKSSELLDHIYPVEIFLFVLISCNSSIFVALQHRNNNFNSIS